MATSAATRLRRGGIWVILSMVAGLWLAPPAAAQEDKEFFLPRSAIFVHVDEQGVVYVEEQITFDFAGSFSGAYRDIPMRPREQLTNVRVSEGDRQYLPGASTGLGSFGLSGTFGTERIGDVQRVVWHYSALNESLRFTVAYEFRGLAVAYDDVVEVNLRVWGDEWQTELVPSRPT